ncbi:MAG: Fe-S cluster protein [Calditrichaeota bacterium]|nr:MAG: Fe-S cluster protein [Calditrichota bacterium]
MEFLTSVGFLTGLSIVLALLLVFANRKLSVYEDPRIAQVQDMLPGANCGACGVPGCAAFSEELVAGKALPSGCSVGGPETAEAIASFLGIDAGSAERKIARLLCAGGCDVAGDIVDYAGFSSCRAAATVAGGSKACTWGCLGLADCEVACDFDAIHMGSTGLPVVDADKCTACGDCVDICPKNLFELHSENQKLLVQCKSLLAGDDATDLCQVACTGCGICAADAPAGLIEMKNNLAIVDKNNFFDQTEIATLRCPTGAIIWLDGQQFPKEQRSAKLQKI